MTSLNFRGCSMGSSAGLAPLRTLSAEDTRTPVLVLLAPLALRAGALVLEPGAQPQLQLAGGLLGERQRRDRLHGAATLGQHVHQARDQLAGLARPVQDRDLCAWQQRGLFPLRGWRKHRSTK